MSAATAVYWSFWSVRWLWNLAYLRLHPFVVAMGTEVLDKFDSPLWKLSGGSAEQYNRFDKLADGSFYLASLVFIGYFFHQLTWPRPLLWALIVLLSLRLFFVNTVGALLLPEITWFGVLVPNYGGALLEVYAGLDFFRLLGRLKRFWQHLVICALVVVGKTVQELVLRQPEHVYALSPPECDSLEHCFGLWWFPALAFFVFAVWAGYVRQPEKLRVRTIFVR
jgi:hypothetical protein